MQFGVEFPSFRTLLLLHIQGPVITRIMDYLDPEGGVNTLFQHVCCYRYQLETNQLVEDLNCSLVVVTV